MNIIAVTFLHYVKQVFGYNKFFTWKYLLYTLGTGLYKNYSTDLHQILHGDAILHHAPRSVVQVLIW